jgi:hypothetical protein
VRNGPIPLAKAAAPRHRPRGALPLLAGGGHITEPCFTWTAVPRRPLRVAPDADAARGYGRLSARGDDAAEPDLIDRIRGVDRRVDVVYPTTPRCHAPVGPSAPGAQRAGGSRCLRRGDPRPRAARACAVARRQEQLRWIRAMSAGVGRLVERVGLSSPTS